MTDTIQKPSKQKDKTKTVLIDILTRLNSGQTAPDIRKAYGWKRQRLDYHLKNLRKAGLIVVKARSSMNVYALSEQSKKILSEHLSGFEGLVLHNVEYSYPIITDTDRFQPDKQWMWGKLLVRAKKLSGCSVKVMGRTLVISVEHLPGMDSFQLADEAKNIADKTALWLGTQGFSLGDGHLSRKPHFGIIGPLAKKIAEQVQVRSETYQIDKSLGGEVEFFTPETADSYMRMPETLKAMAESQKADREILFGFTKQFELHYAVLNDIKDAVRELRDAVKEMKK